MLEGWKAYALPLVAAALLLAFFGYRCSVEAPEPEAPATANPSARPEPTSNRDRIEAAIADAGPSAPPLPDRYRDTVADALRPIVARCRRPDERAHALALHVEVAAAQDLGGIVRAIEARHASAALIDCIEQNTRTLTLPDAAATGIGRYDIEP
jgi:hypothetical protein